MNIGNKNNNFTVIPIEVPKRIELKYGQEFGYYKEHIDIIKIGFIPKRMEDKWYIYEKDNWIHFIRSWNGQEIYRAEIKYINERYMINDFYVERKTKNYNNKDDLFDIHILHILIDWGLLKIDNRNMYLTLFNKTEKDSMKLLNILGSFYISPEEVKAYSIEEEKKYPCSKIFEFIDNKFETFLFFIETLQYQKRIPLEIIKDIFDKIDSLAIIIENINIDILDLVKNKEDVNIILERLNNILKYIYNIIDKIENENMHYCINENRYLSIEEVINNLISNSSFVNLEKKTIDKFILYKNIFKNDIFKNEKMLRVDL